MAVDVATACATLHARWTQIQTTLATGSAVSSFSDQGRSQTIDRAELTAELLDIEQRAARIGCPIAGQVFVFVTPQRYRP